MTSQSDAPVDLSQIPHGVAKCAIRDGKLRAMLREDGSIVFTALAQATPRGRWSVVESGVVTHQEARSRFPELFKAKASVTPLLRALLTAVAENEKMAKAASKMKRLESLVKSEDVTKVDTCELTNPILKTTFTAEVITYVDDSAFSLVKDQLRTESYPEAFMEIADRPGDLLQAIARHTTDECHLEFWKQRLSFYNACIDPEAGAAKGKRRRESTGADKPSKSSKPKSPAKGPLADAKDYVKGFVCPTSKDRLALVAVGTCQVCMDSPFGEIWRCKSGHMLCEHCHSGMLAHGGPRCCCGSTEIFQDRALENMFAKVTVECPHDGCEYACTFEESHAHVNECQHRPQRASTEAEADEGHWSDTPPGSPLRRDYRASDTPHPGSPSWRHPAGSPPYPPGSPHSRYSPSGSPYSRYSPLGSPGYSPTSPANTDIDPPGMVLH